MGVLWSGSIASRGQQQAGHHVAAHTKPVCAREKPGARRRSGPGSTRPAWACRWHWVTARGWGWSSPCGCPGSPGTGQRWVGDPQAGGVPPALCKASCNENMDHCGVGHVLGHLSTHQSRFGKSPAPKISLQTRPSQPQPGPSPGGY